MILAITLTIISAALSIYAPKLLGRIIQLLYDYRINIEAFPLSSLLDDLTIIALLYTLSYLIKIPANMILSRISEKVVSNVRNALYD